LVKCEADTIKPQGKALSFWNKLSKVQKIIFGSGLAVILLFTIIMLFG